MLLRPVAAHPRVCCWGNTGLHARGHGATAGVSGFNPAHSDDLEVWFRAPAGRMPDVLEIGMRGRRHPRVEVVRSRDWYTVGRLTLNRAAISATLRRYWACQIAAGSLVPAG